MFKIRFLLLDAVVVFVFALLVAGLFMAVTGLAMVTGHWRTSLSRQDYLQLMPEAQAAGQR